MPENVELWNPDLPPLAVLADGIVESINIILGSSPQLQGNQATGREHHRLSTP